MNTYSDVAVRALGTLIRVAMDTDSPDLREPGLAASPLDGEAARLHAANVVLQRAARLQAALAAVGACALAAADLPALLEEVASHTAQALGVEFSIIARLSANETLEICAASNWALGRRPVALSGTLSERLLGAGAPFVELDWRASPLPIPPLLRSHGVVASVAAVVRGRCGPWGVLWVHSVRADGLRAEDAGFVESVAAVLALAIERAAADEARAAEQAALRESESRFRQVVERIDQVVWLAELGLQELLYVSPAYERLFCRDPERLRRDPLDFLQVVHPEDRAGVHLAAARAAFGAELDETYRVVLPGGEVRWIRDRAFPIHDAEGTVRRIAGIAEDVTAARRGEEERARLLEQERAARALAEAALGQLHAMQAITESTRSAVALEDLLRELLGRLRRNLRADVAMVWLVDAARGELYPRACDGLPLESFEEEGIPLRAIDLEAPGRLDGERPSAYARHEWHARMASAAGVSLPALVSTPLIVDGKLSGILAVASRGGGPYGSEHRRLLQMVADQVAPSIERGLLVETVSAARARLEALSQRLLLAQEEERRRVSMELHDELGQILTAIKINLESLQREVGGRARERLGQAIAEVQAATRKVRDIALELRPSVLDDLGLAAAVRSHLDRFRSDTGLRLQASIGEFAERPLDAASETACFRILQEALTNVVRHARAQQVRVDLACREGRLELRVLDDGCGFAAGRALARPGSLGLVGMQERAALCGGTFSLDSTPSGGTQVRASFPLRPAGDRR